MKRLLHAFVFAAAAALFTIPAQAQTVLRIGTAVPAGSPQGVAWDRVAELVKESNSGIDVRIYHGGQLGTPEAQIQNVRIGAQDGFVEGITWWESFSDNMGLEAAPFVFDGREHLSRWFGSEHFAAIQEDIVANGNQRLIFSDHMWWRGPFRVLVAKKPVLTLDDVKATKLRMPASELLTRYWGPSGLGAQIVNIAWNDTYLSILQGIVDGVVSPFDLVVSMRFVEIAKHIMLIDEYQTPIVVGMNETKWQSLSDEQRSAFTAAMTKAGEEYTAALDANVANWTAELEAAGATIHEFDRRPFVDKVRELNERYVTEGHIPEGLIEQIDSLR